MLRALNSSRKIKIVEVGPRDGLQNERVILSHEPKCFYVKKLVDAGAKYIEFGAFVSKRVPQMLNSDLVLKTLGKKDGVKYIALVPNKTYAEKALDAGANELAVFTTVSEEFSQKNTNCDVKTSLERINEVVELAKSRDIPVRGYISCTLGCPYEGFRYNYPRRTGEIANDLYKMGCYEISVADTIGKGDPKRTLSVLENTAKWVPTNDIAVHFHNTYGRGLVNLVTALDFGINTVDTSSGGLGGCPFAKGATGNLATEDVVDLLDNMGLEHDFDLSKLLGATNFIHRILDKESESLVVRAYNRKIEY